MNSEANYDFDNKKLIEFKNVNIYYELEKILKNQKDIIERHSISNSGNKRSIFVSKDSDYYRGYLNTSIIISLLKGEASKGTIWYKRPRNRAHREFIFDDDKLIMCKKYEGIYGEKPRLSSIDYLFYENNFQSGIEIMEPLNYYNDFNQLYSPAYHEMINSIAGLEEKLSQFNDNYPIYVSKSFFENEKLKTNYLAHITSGEISILCKENYFYDNNGLLVQCENEQYSLCFETTAFGYYAVKKQMTKRLEQFIQLRKVERFTLNYNKDFNVDSYDFYYKTASKKVTKKIKLKKPVEIKQNRFLSKHYWC